MRDWTTPRSWVPTWVGVWLIVAHLAPAADGVVATTLTLSVYEGPPTTRITAIGAGFGPSEVVRITFGGRQIAQAMTTDSGDFTKSARIPRQAQPGDHLITATGKDSHLSASANFNVGTDWATFRFSSERTGYNRYENTLSRMNVSQLGQKWKAPAAAETGVAPAVVDETVYTGDLGGFVYALDAATGEQRWKVFIGGSGVSDPTVADGVVYVANNLGGTLRALDAATGAVIWERFLGGGVYEAAVVSRGILYIGSNGGSLFALDAATGAIQWQAEYPGAPDAPAVVDGAVYVGGNDRRLYAFDSVTGAELWSVELEDIVDATPAVVSGIVYVGSSNLPPWKLYAIAASNGTILWSASAPSAVIASPAVGNGLVYAVYYEGGTQALDAATGAVEWTSSVGGCGSSPALANGVVYVGSTDFNIYALDATTGATLWNSATGGMACASPAVADGVVYTGSFDANFYAFGLP